MVRFGRGSASVELATRHAACSARSTRRLTARGAPGSRCADKAQKGGLPCECRLISPALIFTKRGFFGILTKQSLSLTNFLSKKALRDHIASYITGWNANPTPFIWTKPAAAIIRSHRKMIDRISGAVH
jgi:hypothetical protein